MNNSHSIEELRDLQAMPLDIKIATTVQRIREWIREFGKENVYVSFSGGKDSTVLLDIVRKYYPSVGAVFVDTGLEYPELRQFVKTFDNVKILRPEMRFDEVIKKYGYPIIGKRQAEAVYLCKKNIENKKYYLRAALLGITADEANKLGLELPDNSMLQRYEKTIKNSKYDFPKYKKMLDVDFNISHMCCDVMKKKPAFKYQKKTGKMPILATMAAESQQRETAWLKHSCNAFNSKHPSSQPMSFWAEQDVLNYIKKNNLKIASPYGEVVWKDLKSDDCYYNLICDDCGSQLTTTGCKRTGCIFCGFGLHMEKSPTRFQLLKKSHPKQYEYCIGGGEYDAFGIWQPNKKGLGMKKVFDTLNNIYGENFIKYE